MRLEITPCKSLDWQKSLLAIEAEQIFYSSINEKEWFPDWYQEHKEEYDKLGHNSASSTCNPFSDSRNIQIYNQKLMELCTKWGVPYKSTLRAKDQIAIYQIDTGIESFEIYYLRSAYNEIGTNSILRALNLMDLYEIFGVSQKDLEINPNYLVIDWNETASKAEFIIEELKKHTRIGNDSYMFITGQMNTIIKFSKIVAEDNPDFYRVLWSE